jgi:hypothetical protein
MHDKLTYLRKFSENGSRPGITNIFVAYSKQRKKSLKINFSKGAGISQQPFTTKLVIQSSATDFVGNNRSTVVAVHVD